MDTVRGFEDDRGTQDVGLHHSASHGEGTHDRGDATRIDVGTDERRMHVRAYHHWVSLLQGRDYPSIEDLDPASISDFGPHSVLLDFSQGIENPAIQFLGRALRQECDLDASVTHIGQVPSRSLLSRLTDHYLQIIANRAPIGFEAEFVGTRGHNTVYRGILMPFSSDDDTIDFIYGVINWKELVDAETQARLDHEISAAVKNAPKLVTTGQVWADGPSATVEQTEQDMDQGGIMSSIAPEGTLFDQLMLAQQTAAAVRASDIRTRTALYRALARAHDFAAAADADPVGYEQLLGNAGIAVQLRAPMTPVVKLVFGADYDKTRLTEYAAVLAYARRVEVATGELGSFLDGFDGGIKGVVKAERAARTPTRARAADPAATLDARPTLASLNLETGTAKGDYVVLLARSGEAGMLDIIAAIGGDPGLTQRAMRQATL